MLQGDVMADLRAGSVLQHLRRVFAHASDVEVSDAELLERFVKAADKAAFELLVWRHERMVLGVCRRVLRNYHDAEDAFQATFLVLARKAASIRNQQSVAGWLHCVASRVAHHARSKASRRERPGGHDADLASVPSPGEPGGELRARDLGPVLDEEVNRLPEKYRLPVVLCYLEGKTYEEAARQLGCPKGTLSGRLARARGMLRARLARRGVDLGAGLLAAALCEYAAAAAVPAALVTTTVKAALLVASGRAATVAASPEIAALAEGVVRSMLVHKLKFVSVFLAAFLACAGSGTYLAVLHACMPGQPALPDKRAPEPAATKGKRAEGERVAVIAADEAPRPRPVEARDAKPGPGYLTGRVMGPDGKPIAGARVWCRAHGAKPIAETRTDSDGCYRIGPFAATVGQREDLLIEAGGLARQYVAAPAVFSDQDRNLGDLMLARGQRVRGVLLDVDGKPRAGATVEVFLQRYTLGHSWLEIGEPYRIPTDAQGKFESPPLPIGGGHIVVRVPERVFLQEPLQLRPGKDEKVTLQLRPDKPFVVHVVTEEGQAVAGARLLGFWLHEDLISDAQGRIQLRGLDRAPPVLLRLQAEGYPQQEVIVHQEHTRIVLQKPVYLYGKIVDADTGAPVKLSRIVICQLRRTSEGKLEPFG